MLDLLETYKDFLNNIASRSNVMLYYNNSLISLRILVIYERQTRSFFAFLCLCLCHCLLTPLLVLVMGTHLVLGYLEAEWVDRLLLFPVFVIALSSISKRYLVKRNQWLLILTSSGFITIITTQFNHGVNEIWLTVLGSICLIGAHFRSLTLARHKATS
jgi:hypothetical protein